MRNIKIFLIVSAFVFIMPFGIARAQAPDLGAIDAALIASSSINSLELESGTSSQNLPHEALFEAEVMEILSERRQTRDNGSVYTQQDLRLRGLDGSFKNRELVYKGISELDVVSANVYSPGDKVLVEYSRNPEGKEIFAITDYVRRAPLYLLAAAFVLIIIAIGRKKGLRSLLALILTFFIILKFMLPLFLRGYDPLMISVAAAAISLAIIIYLTEGFSRQSHLAMLSITFSLLLTFFLSQIFSNLAHLTGMAQEEVIFLMGSAKAAINFKGLLLAGILIGTTGVLDDIVIAQFEAVKQIKTINPNLNFPQTFKAAYKIGNTHLGAIINTLFLTYAGASLPLLLLFSLHQEPFLTFAQVINNEMVATEIVRTLVGSIGVAMSLPIATFVAARWLVRHPTGK